MTSVELRPDDPMAARLARATASFEPDPLFRRRLRGRVLNQHVAVREGLAGWDRPRQMGRLGRSVLIASLALAISVGGAAATSQQALPGDILYPMKLQIEEVRLRAAPAWMRDGLELAALDERLTEVERLAAVGRWTDMAVAVDAALVARQQVVADALAVGPAAGAALQRHVTRLEQLLTMVPEAARRGIEHALEASGSGPNRPAPENHGAAPAVPHSPDGPATPAKPSHPAASADSSHSAGPAKPSHPAASADSSHSASPAKSSLPATPADSSHPATQGPVIR